VSELASIVLVHGAGTGPWVFDTWPAAFCGAEVIAVDLQQGLDVGSASMGDYAARVADAITRAPRPAAVCGWSMGGLVALQAAHLVAPDVLVVIEPSAPAETQFRRIESEPLPGTFDPEEVYGAFPSGVAKRPESLPARLERKRGISIASLPCPALVVCGRDCPAERGVAIIAHYGTASLHFPRFGHFRLLIEPDVTRAIRRWIESVLRGHPPIGGGRST
jgi:pimeloyl-ACP methyl ester carboxylesterase